MPENLYRSNKNRIIAGVCAGIANYFNIEVTFLRIGLIIVVFMARTIMPVVTFVISIAYIIGWVLIPLKDDLH